MVCWKISVQNKVWLKRTKRVSVSGHSKNANSYPRPKLNGTVYEIGNQTGRRDCSSELPQIDRRVPIGPFGNEEYHKALVQRVEHNDPKRMRSVCETETTLKHICPEINRTNLRNKIPFQITYR